MIPDATESASDGPEVGPFQDTGLRPRSDTGSRADTRAVSMDTKPIGCVRSLPATFVCEPPVAKGGKTTCTDAMLIEFLDACVGASATSATCETWRLKFPGCNDCAMDWIYVPDYSDDLQWDTGACLRAIAPASDCGKAWRCATECLGAVCAECDPTASDAAASERAECERNAKATAGACYALAAGDLAKCEGDPALAVCFVRTPSDLLTFLRGACRDGGAWSVSTTDASVEDGG